MAADGISRLITVTQMKTENANQNAMDGADKQRDLVRGQQCLHAAQSKIDEIVRKKDISDDEYWAIDRMLKGQDVSNAGFDGSWNGLLGNTQNGTDGHWHAKLDDSGASSVEGKNAKLVDSMKSRLEGKGKDLEAQDKLGNFEINDLMSQYNQSETLASSVMKKRDDTGNALIQKI